MAAECNLDGCGVLAIGRCSDCGQAFCGSHRHGDATCTLCHLKSLPKPKSCSYCDRTTEAKSHTCRKCSRPFCTDHAKLYGGATADSSIWLCANRIEAWQDAEQSYWIAVESWSLSVPRRIAYVLGALEAAGKTPKNRSHRAYREMRSNSRAKKEEKLRIAIRAKQYASGVKATRLDNQIARLTNQLYRVEDLDPAYPIGSSEWRYQGEAARHHIRKEDRASLRSETGVTPSGAIVLMSGPTADSVIRCTLSEPTILARLEQYAAQRFVVLTSHSEAEELSRAEVERPEAPELRLRNGPTPTSSAGC